MSTTASHSLIASRSPGPITSLQAAERPLVLAIDIGTSSIRAVIFDRLGRAVQDQQARRGFLLRTEADGTVEADADEILQRLWECIDEVLARLGSASGELAAVGSCTFVNNLLGVDVGGEAVTPLTTYSDTRAAPDAALLRAEMDEHAIHQRTGVYFHPSYLPARLRWIQREKPEWLARADYWLSLDEYAALTLFGRRRVSYSTAAWSGLLDRWLLDWNTELLSILPVYKEQFSSLVNFDDPDRGLREPYASRWPALREIPWFPAAGDGATANLGSGCISPQQIAVTMGTSTAVRVVLESEPATVPDGLWCYRVDRQLPLMGGALSEGGNILNWLGQILQLPANAEALAAAIPPDSHGLTFLPLLAGERSPGWAGEARGILTGISLGTTPLAILRAALEGVACRVALVYQLLSAALPLGGSDKSHLVGSGGTLQHSPAMAQIIADVIGMPLTISIAPEASARGAAMLALLAIHAMPDLSAYPFYAGTVLEPDSGRHALYQAAIERQKALYVATIRST